MCVIIITNPKHPITKDELNKAWDTNPDGAGYAYVNNGSVYFRRGYMQKSEYIADVLKLQQKHELLLHLRISTGAGISKQGTHPYKSGNVLKLQGRTKQPVIAMNGIINGQPLETKHGVKLNDTASYIKDHAAAFNVVNHDILNIIADATAAKWSAATPDGIICSDNFEEYNGRQYSNLNHVVYYAAYADLYDYETPTINQCLQLKHIIDAKLLKTLQKDKALYYEVYDYFYNHCRYTDCKYCNNGCLSDCISKADINKFLEANAEIWEKINGGI